MRLSKNMTNLEIAELLRDVAAAYQLKGEEANRFRIIAYQRAADAVEHATSELKDLWDDKKLEDVPGIGKSIAEHLDELFRTGKSKHFEKVMKGLPPSMFELMELPGIGAKTAYRLVKELRIRSDSAGGPLAELERVAKEGKIAELEGFGEESQAEILKGVAEHKGKGERRLLLSYAASISHRIVDWLKKEPSVLEAQPLGSLRRQAATVGDIDIAVASREPQKVLVHFTSYPKTTRVLEKGERTSSIIVPGNIRVDLMVQEPESFGSLLQHFTGSKHHNIALREYARSLSPSLSLSEYGIKNLRTKKLKKLKTEEEFYNTLKLDFIPPELREDAGEIEAAKEHKLPKLIELEDVRGDLQIHSSFNTETSHDLGESSMDEIIEKANELGYEYFAFTEHNPSKSKHSEKQIIEILKRKKEKVDKLNYSIVKTANNRVKKVFNSLEIDMLPSGELPVSHGGLQTLDFALVSIHSSFRQDRAEMTKRVLFGLEHPKVKIFAHPTARKLNEREGVELDWPKIFEFCIKRNKWLEINGEPMRLDLPDTLVREAVKAGVKFTFGTDSHHKEGLNNMIFAVSVARRGWVSKKDVINTLSLSELVKVLQ